MFERKRSSGSKSNPAKTRTRIRVPVVAIHGEEDPHPVAGVREPLAGTPDGFRLVILPRCGHSPWRERQARDEFLRILEGELPTA